MWISPLPAAAVLDPFRKRHCCRSVENDKSVHLKEKEQPVNISPSGNSQVYRTCKKILLETEVSVPIGIRGVLHQLSSYRNKLVTIYQRPNVLLILRLLLKAISARRNMHKFIMRKKGNNISPVSTLAKHCVEPF